MPLSLYADGKSHFSNADTVFAKYDSDTFLLQCLVDISHPQSEYLLEKSTQSQHPVSPKFKIQECIRAFLERATPVLPPPPFPNISHSVIFSE